MHPKLSLPFQSVQLTSVNDAEFCRVRAPFDTINRTVFICKRAWIIKIQLWGSLFSGVCFITSGNQTTLSVHGDEEEVLISVVRLRRNFRSGQHQTRTACKHFHIRTSNISPACTLLLRNYTILYIVEHTNLFCSRAGWRDQLGRNFFARLHSKLQRSWDSETGGRNTVDPDGDRHTLTQRITKQLDETLKESYFWARSIRCNCQRWKTSLSQAKICDFCQIQLVRKHIWKKNLHVYVGAKVLENERQ